jgi:predicted nucleic acid-binding protein
MEWIVTPAAVIYEVHKKIKCEQGEEVAELCVVHIEETRVTPLDQSVALRAADLSLEFSLPMADSLVLATARAFGAELVTSDSDFRAVPGVRVI